MTDTPVATAKKEGLHIVLAAGGTGGHVFPAEALAQELRRREINLTLMTDRRGEGYPGTLGEVDTIRINAGAVHGLGMTARFKGAMNLGLGLLQAKRILKRLQPDAVVGFGGYASLPPVMGAMYLGIPTVIHEQNAIAGRANRLVAPRVSRLAIAFPLARPIRGVTPVLTGEPVRPGVMALKDRPYQAPQADETFNLLVFGGSQGAQIFSTLLPEALALLPAEARARLRLTQQCRPETLEETRMRYARLGIEATLAPFFVDLPERMANAHLVICRSGASTIGELAVLGRPSILIPYPHAIDDHQSANARVMSEAGGGWLMPQEPMTAESLSGRIHSLMTGPDALARASACARAVGIPDAPTRLADLVIEAATAKRKGAGA